MTTQRLPLRDARAPEDPLAWLLPFRWAVVVIEATMMLAAGPLGGPAIEAWGWAVPALQTATNLAARFLAGRGVDRPRIAGLLLVLDAALLTALFAASGGSANPFTTFYLVLIVFSALVLRPVWSWATAAASVAGFSLLFALPPDPSLHAHHGAFSWHLRGMWVAFAAAATATALFVTLLRQARDRRERDVERLRDLARAERDRVNVHLAPELPTILAPARGIERSIFTLLQNAIEASPGALPIDLGIDRDGDRVVFRVADRGVGIAAELARRVGEPFLSTKGEHGLGLGLFAASRLAELLGGTFTLEPREGGGAVAAFAVPIEPFEAPRR